VLGTAKVVVEGLPRGLSQLKANWPTSLPLPNIGSVDGIAVGRYIIDPQRNEVATTQFCCQWQD
jgi:hypothetical protein